MDTNKPSKLNRIFYWNGDKVIGNFGDILSYYIFEKMSEIKHQYYNAVIQKELLEHYICIGSIMHFSTRNSLVWGSGIIDSNTPNIQFKKIYCVRGPRTRKALLDQKHIIPEKYGDPALLMPLFYTPKTHKKYKIGIIPHIIDYDKICKMFSDKTYSEINIINLNVHKTNESLEHVIDEIHSCEFILSSSLHGVILSNAYNIPVVRFNESKLAGNDIKFVDYFESIYSNKHICQLLLPIKELIHNIEITKQTYQCPDLISQRQKDLIETCPFINESLKETLLEKIIYLSA